MARIKEAPRAYLPPQPGASALVVVVSRRRTALWRVDGESISEIESWDEEPSAVEVPHMSAPPKVGFHRGTGGSTATDTMQRRSSHSVERNLTRARNRVNFLARDGEWVLVTGDRHVAARLHHTITPRLRERSVLVDIARPGSSAHDVAAGARAALRDLERQRTDALLDELLGCATQQTVAVGDDAVASALERAAVDTLLVAEPRLERNVEATEDLVRRAEAQHGHVRLVSGEAGERLWELAGGTIAALRFPVGAG